MARTELDDLTESVAVSVRDLVHHRLDEKDRWNLALVQRDEVWDQVRMRHLLDSLLANYPIGAILLCRVKNSSQVIRVSSAGRRQHAAEPGAWQLLDGQQRINALFSMFTEQGGYGRFFLNMTMERRPPGPTQARKAKDRSLPYIVHGDTDDHLFEHRDRHVNLSRWASWADTQDDLFALEVDETLVAEALRSLDPEFTCDMTETEAKTAAERFRQLRTLWTTEKIPVLRAEVTDPLDVLEIFTRINLGGVNVAGADVYFAGIKTFWAEKGVDAEQRLDSVVAGAPILRRRLAALRFVSRIASRCIGRGDVLPLAVDHLAGPRGTQLLSVMDELTLDDSPAMERVAAFSRWYTTNSELGYVLRLVASELWDDVLGWAAASERRDDDWYRHNLARIDAYLLGATIFGFRGVMGTTFHSLALVESLAAGHLGELFPTEQIVAVARGRTQLTGSRGRRVLGLLDTDDRARLASRGGWVLTAVAQRIPYSWEAEENFDWDHIFPKAHASRMWAPGDGRRRHHPHRHLINSTGNFWALNLSANRALGKTVGERKFEFLRRWSEDPDEKHRVWEEERWSISDQEIRDFIEVDRLLDSKDFASVDGGMTLFKKTVQSRADRLLEEALDRFPLARLFAFDSGQLPDSATRLRSDLGESLGLSSLDRNLERLEARDAADILKRRAAELSADIAQRLQADDKFVDGWIWRLRKQVGHCVAYEVSSGRCIELVITWAPSEGALLTVKAYPARGRHNDLFEDFDHRPLGRLWSASNDEIADRFMVHVEELGKRYPRE